MKKPTLEEVRKYFENAKIVKSLYGGIYEYKGGVHFYQGSYFCKTTGTDCIIWEKTIGYAKIIEYKEPKFEITKEQILKLSGINCVNKEHLNEWFPEVFEVDLEAGKWYKHSSISDYLVLYTGKNEAVGFMDGSWYSHLLFGSQRLKQGCVEATTKEVTEALKNEAKKRYKEGDYFDSLEESFNNRHVGCIMGSEFEYDPISNSLRTVTHKKTWDKNQSNPTVFLKGQWAEIIPSKKMTQQQIEKELGYKIEIV